MLQAVKDIMRYDIRQYINTSPVLIFYCGCFWPHYKGVMDMSKNELYTLGIDIGSTTVKIAILDKDNDVAFSDYERHYANIQETLSDLLGRAVYKLGGI